MKPFAPSAIVRKPHARILIRGTNWVGDAVMTMPAVQRLRELEPDAHITLLGPTKLLDIWRHNPFLNDATDTLRGEFDVAVIFPNSFRSAWECWRAHIPTRVGFAGHWRRRLLTNVVEEPHGDRAVYKTVTVDGKTFRIKSFPVIRHQAHRYLDLISYLGGNRDFVPPKIWLAPGELPSLRKFLTEGARPFFGINAGAEYGPAKRWMPERFAEVARRISAEVACRWLLFGGPGDVEIAGRIEAELRAHLNDDRAVINVAGKTTLLELCELLKFCRLLVTNDTGPMHLADALGTPQVAIFASTSAELTGPTGKNSRVVNVPVECNPCFLPECPIDDRCHDRITVDLVTQTALKLWQDTEQTHGHS